MRNLTRCLPALAFASTAVLLAGCAMQPAQLAPGTGLQGTIHGGQQPIGGVTVQVYTVGTGGDGTAAQPLFTPAVTTTPYGNFTFPAYTCPSGNPLAYIVGTGGNPGLASGTNNGQIAEMAVLGPCNTMTASNIAVNEQTTVAAVYALAPYMSSPSAVASGAGDAAGLAAAFALAQALVSSSTGKTPGTNVPTGFTVPIAQIATVADIMATCINSSGGASGDTTPCGKFIGWTTPTGVTPPTDTIDALLNLANNPTLNTMQLFGMASSTGPYQPSDTIQPADLSISLVPSTTMSLSPSTLNTLFTGLGSSSQETVTVMNTGPAAMNVTGIGISGTNAAVFSQTNNCGTLVAASNSCSITITFTPAVNFNAVATLTVATTATNSPQTIGVGGYGLTGQLSLSPSSVTFPPGPVGTASTAQPVTLTNVGPTGTVTLGTISTAGGTGDFSETNNCPATLTVNAFCTVMVNLTPSAAGARTGGLVVTSNSSYQSPSTSLMGTGTVVVSGTLAVSTPALFIPAGTGFVDLTNTGTVPVTISSIVAPSSETDNCGTSLAVGASCAIALQALSAGQQSSYSYVSGSLTINNSSTVPQITVAIYSTNGGNARNLGSLAVGTTEQLPYSGMGGETVTFTGVNAGDFTNAHCNSGYHTTCGFSTPFIPSGVGARVATETTQSGYSGTAVETDYGFGLAPGVTVQTITANPSSLSFPQTALNAVSASQTMTISNPQGHLLNFAATTTTGNPYKPVDYQVTPTICTTTSCTVSVAFAPLTMVNYGAPSSASLYVYDSATNGTTNFALTGYAGIPAVTLSPSPISFGSVPVNSTSAAMSTYVFSTGDSPAYIKLSVPGGANGTDFTQFSLSETITTNAAGTTPAYQFTPSAPGTRTGTVTVTDSRTGLVLGSLPLTGTGLGVPSLSSLPSSASFGMNNVGVASASQTVTVSNGGSATATLGAISITGANLGDFSQTNNCMGSLAIGGSCSFVIVFTPGAATARSASLSVASNDPNSPLLIPLSGTGTAPSGGGVLVTTTPSLFLQGGDGYQRFVDLTNTASVPVTLSSIVTASPFIQTNTCGTSLSAGASCAISLTSTSTSPALTTGSLTINSNATVPQISVALYTSRNAQDFNSVAVGSTDGETLTFAGTPGSITASLTGIDASDFTGGSCTVSGGSCNVFIWFNPSSAGVRVASLISSEYGSTTSTQAVYGFGIAPGVVTETLNPSVTSLSFPQTALHAVSPIQTFTIANPQGHLLNIAATVSSAGTYDYQVTPALCSTTSCTVSVAFAPLSAGTSTNNAEILIYDTATDMEGGLDLYGNGGIPALSFSPTQLNFGTATVGSTTAAQTFTVSDTGDSPASLTFHFASGPSANGQQSDFIGETFSATVVAGTPYTVPYAYSFKPIATGNRNATVSITDTRTGLVVGTYLLTGTGQ